MVFDIIGILDYSFANNYVYDYVFSLSVFISSLITLKIFKTAVIRRLKKIAEKTKTEVDNLIISAIDSIRWPFFVLASIYVASRFIQLPVLADRILFYTIFISVAYYTIRIFQKVIDFGADRLIKERQKEEEAADTSVIDLLRKIINVSLWVVGIFFILSNLGYNITPLMAGAGIGGIAVAFALQNILGDVFSAFSIYFDKPFQRGDFIIVGTDMGVVERIGIKSTRIRTLQGQEVVVSNKELTETRVHNYKRMWRRRIVFNFGVKYETSTEKLKRIPLIIKEIIEKIELAELDRVHFTKFGDSSLDYEVVYYFNTSDYNKYMDVQQEINLAIKERFEQENIEMAYPTRTIYMKS